MSSFPQVGVVVPTLFTRDEYLEECIQSLRQSGHVFILLMGPKVGNWKHFTELVDDFLEEPKSGGLAEKLTVAIRSLPETVAYVSWLGDDDILEPGSMVDASQALEDNPRIAFVYGGCSYIDGSGRQIGHNPSGNWAALVMEFGPFLIPQPGSLIRRTHFEEVGGLSPCFHLAFDYDLVLRLKKVGGLKHLRRNQARYRWHGEALSVHSRRKSVQEAARARLSNSIGIRRIIVGLLNPIVAFATLIAGALVSHRSIRSRRVGGN